MSKYVIDIPNWHPVTDNELLRSVRNRIRRKKEDREMVTMYARMQGVPLAQGKRRVRLIITLGPRQRGADPLAYHKSCLDALVCAGALVDDSRHWVEVLPTAYERGRERATRIELEDIADG